VAKMGINLSKSKNKLPTGALAGGFLRKNKKSPRQGGAGVEKMINMRFNC